MQLANPNWNITLTDFGYSDFLLDNTPGFEGREYLSGEWGGAVAYQRSGHTQRPTWLEPNFMFPDWNTNSDFHVVTGIHLVGSNLDGLPIAESVISNGDLEITLRFEMVDTVTGTPMGVKPASAAGLPTSTAATVASILIAAPIAESDTGLDGHRGAGGDRNLFDAAHLHHALLHRALVDLHTLGARQSERLSACCGLEAEARAFEGKIGR